MDFFVNRAGLHLALRELRAVYTDRRALIVMALVGVLAGLVGPFGTFEALPGPVRVLYWLTIVFCTYGAGLFGAMLAGTLVPGKTPRWLHVSAMSAGAALPVTLSVVAISQVLFGISAAAGWTAFLALLAYCFGISLVVLTFLEIVAPMFLARPEAARGAPRLLDRLPPHLRGPLTHLSMADHYVEVHTEKGSALVLMRFADAIGETGSIEGLQIHRSHWVARAAVARLVRENAKPMVELRSGIRLPVSRSFLAAARAAFG